MPRVPIIPTPIPKSKDDKRKENERKTSKPKPSTDNIDLSKAENSVYDVGKSGDGNEGWVDFGSDAVDALGAIAQWIGGGELYKSVVKQIAKYNGTLPDSVFQSLISKLVSGALAKGNIAVNELTTALNKLDSLTNVSPTIKEFLGDTKAKLRARLKTISNKNTMLAAAAQVANTQANSASDLYNTAGDYATGRVGQKQQAAYDTASKALDLAKTIEQDVSGKETN